MYQIILFVDKMYHNNPFHPNQHPEEYPEEFFDRELGDTHTCANARSTQVEYNGS